jgi:hypothetical protein
MVTIGCGSSDKHSADQATTAGPVPTTTTTTTTGASTSSSPISSSTSTLPATTTTALAGASTDPVKTPDTPGGPGQTALLVDVRTGQHSGYERVVFEFANMLPGYSVQYVSKPVHADPSDSIVDVPGEEVILVRMAMASGVDATATPVHDTYTGPSRLDTGYPTVAGLAAVGDFEAVLNWAIGVMNRAPFVVTALADPPRLVIDIASAG